MNPNFLRSYTLDDIRIRSGGTGRTVEAYAAIFDTPTEIYDQEGHYLEQIDKAAFTRSIGQHPVFPVIYNHGMTLHGTPDSRGSVPIGTSTEVRVDGKGLFTVAEYNRNALADEVLEAIRSGSVRAQSFSGRFLRSTPTIPRGGYRPAAGGALPKVKRLEIAMAEFGPTPMPAYQGAEITGVRALAALLAGNGVNLSTINTGTTPDGDSDPDATGDEPLGVSTEGSRDAHPARSPESVRARIRAARISRNME